MIQQNLTEWDEDIQASPEDEYAALVRAIRWAKGFSLLFVQCSPAEGERLIGRITIDVAEKNVDVLRLDEEIDDLYERVLVHPNIRQVKVLFVTGLEKSLVPYLKPGYGSEGDYYAKDQVPRILGKLNLQREKFKAQLPLCFVFLVPRYAMTYFTRQAADFFDWRSGVWEFVSPQEDLKQEVQQVASGGDFEKYCQWTFQQRSERLLEIEDLIAASDQPDKAKLQFEQGYILIANQNHQGALSSYEAVLNIEPDNHKAISNKGVALLELGRYEDAILCQDSALSIKPNYFQALHEKGIALCYLGRYEDAILCQDSALSIKPDYSQALYEKGIALYHLGWYEEAISCYNAALKITPNLHEATYRKKRAITAQDLYKKAVACPTLLNVGIDNSISLTEFDAKSDILWSQNEWICVNHDFLLNKILPIEAIGEEEATSGFYNKVLNTPPVDYESLYSEGIIMEEIGRYEAAMYFYNAALRIKTREYSLLHRKGELLEKLGRYKQAIDCYSTVLDIKPDKYEAFYRKGAALRKLGKSEEADRSILIALELKPRLSWYEKIRRFILRVVVKALQEP